MGSKNTLWKITDRYKEDLEKKDGSWTKGEQLNKSAFKCHLSQLQQKLTSN